MGSRDEQRANALAAQLSADWPSRALRIRGGANSAAASADIVVIATLWEAAVPTVAGLAVQLEGKIVISMANALAKVGKEMFALVPPRGSLAESVQRAAPGAQVVAALHHLPAADLADLETALEADVLVCSDHRSARSATIELIEQIPGLRGIDSGSLSYASAVEAFTAVLVGINMRYKAHASIRITGLDGRAQ